MEIKLRIEDDYENAGYLYGLEVTTNSYEEFVTVREELYKLNKQLTEKKRKMIYG